jgi:hypothetical protein
MQYLSGAVEHLFAALLIFRIGDQTLLMQVVLRA